MQVIDWVKALNSYKNLVPLATLHNNDSDRLMKLGNKLFSHSTGPFWGKTRRKKRPVKVRLAQCGILKRAQNILLRVHLDSLAEKHYERKIIAFKMTVAEKV